MSSGNNCQILKSIKKCYLFLFLAKGRYQNGEEIMATKDGYPETPRNLEACEGRTCT